VTAVFVPEVAPRRRRPPAAPAPSPVAPEAVSPDAVAPARARRAASFRPTTAAPEQVEATTPSPAPDVTETAAAATEGYVVFQVGTTAFSVSVVEVREIVRAARLELLPDARASYGHGVALVDARGRSVPVVDLRSDRSRTGDVLLPMWRHQVGLVVDRVLAVQSPRELVREHDDVPAALPSYARGVLRPVDGGAPVLLIALPDAAELDADSARTEEPRLGSDALAVLGLDGPEAPQPQGPDND
jgi:chemotaxis signal transduction protein